MHHAQDVEMEGVSQGLLRDLRIIVALSGREQLDFLRPELEDCTRIAESGSIVSAAEVSEASRMLPGLKSLVTQLGTGESVRMLKIDVLI